MVKPNLFFIFTLHITRGYLLLLMVTYLVTSGYLIALVITQMYYFLTMQFFDC